MIIFMLGYAVGAVTGGAVLFALLYLIDRNE